MSINTLNSPDISTKPPISFTKCAAEKAWEFIYEERENLSLEASNALRLRVFITGGGCQGFRYDFDFSTHIDEGDTVVQQTIDTDIGPSKQVVVDLLIDSHSLQYLRGAEIDYICDLQGERFLIRNLKAKTTCGCGSSFSA